MFLFCRKAVVKTILYTNDEGTFFDEKLLRLIQLKKNTEVSSILENVDPCLLKDSSGNTLLHFAAKYGNEEFAQHLIDLGVEVDVRNQSAETPLMSAIDEHQERTIKLLLKSNADPFVSATRGKCVLARVFNGIQSIDGWIVRAVLARVTVDSLKKNEHVNSQKFHSDCPLHHFMLLKDSKITRIILEKGGSVGARKPITQDTALHIAVEKLDLKNVEVLLEYKADVNAQRYDKKTPIACLQIKADKDQSKVLAISKVLIAAGAKLIDHSSRVIAAEPLLSNGNREIIREVLKCLVDLDFRNEKGEAALHILARNKHPDVLEEVRDLGSAAKVRNKAGFAMLHIAAAEANVNAIKSLLDHGADVNIEDGNGITPLFYTVCSFAPLNATAGKETLRNYLHSIEILLEYGAKPQLRPSIYEVHDFEAVKDRYMLLATPVLAQLALLDASGERVRQIHQIKATPHYQIAFDSSKQQLEEMKKIQIDKSTGLFDFLIASDRQISQYARNQRLILNLTEAMKDYSSDSYYHRMLRKRFSKFSQLVETRKKVTMAINEAFNKLYEVSVDAIAEKIVSYLNDEELRRILPIFE